MIQRNGHYIVVKAKNMTSTAICLKCRAEISAINYDGQSDPSMNIAFEYFCKGDWKVSKSLLKAAASEAEAAVKMLRDWMVYDRKPKKSRVLPGTTHPEEAVGVIALGATVLYVSDSGKEYEAMVIGIPENPDHAGTPDPTLSLEFLDELGKAVRKERVLPEAAAQVKRQVWRRKA